MKKLTTKLLGMFMIAGMVSSFASCSDDDDPGVTIPQITVERSHYNLATGSIEVLIKADAAPATDIAIPVKVAGTAQIDEYTLSASQFVLKAGETRSSITVTRIEEKIGEDNKTLVLNLERGEGYTLGLTNYAEITLLSKNGYIMTFEQSKVRVNVSDEFGVTLFTMGGVPYKPQSEETFTVEVDTENSTAVEGEHFKFTDGKTVKISKVNRGTFTIEVLKAETDKDKLVLRLADKAGYACGSNSTMEITIAGKDNFSGTWAFPSNIYNISLFSDYGEDTNAAPKSSSADRITFAGGPDEYTFTPSISGDYKNYFGTETRTVKFDKMVGKNFQEIMDKYGRNVQVAQLIFPNINVNFSAAASTVRDAKICFRLIEVDNQEVLECTIDDWVPVETEFGGMIYSFMEDMEWAPIRLHLSRVN